MCVLNENENKIALGVQYVSSFLGATNFRLISNEAEVGKRVTTTLTTLVTRTKIRRIIIKEKRRMVTLTNHDINSSTINSPRSRYDRSATDQSPCRLLQD